MNESDIDDLVVQVAGHLEGFTPLIRPGHPAYLLGPGGARLVVHPLWNQAGKIAVLGVYPDGSRGLFPDLSRHQVAVTVGRGAESVAKKIAHRLLPGYQRDLARCFERLADRAVESSNRAEFVATLLAMLPGVTVTEKKRETVIQWRLGEASGSFTVHGDTAVNSIEIRTADRELTERVAYAVQQRSM
ncbi:hypothetical protein [Planotetraspora kaengkrachanensis]|uniref:Uncharacterized protein n=1 Tax=Planotetraspora kaengkrachanensis TaxID=575193 RepID=A0A8J3LVQ1_9ACTN|nr:hypothetical protein [Planotetraspora kaengkrachanensis]GIG79973.1 hypothetical protein Pka01_31000 [Planotetraspora kaengkrachanensis]